MVLCFFVNSLSYSGFLDDVNVTVGYSKNKTRTFEKNMRSTHLQIDVWSYSEKEILYFSFIDKPSIFLNIFTHKFC